MAEREPVTVRLTPEHKRLLDMKAEEAGLESGTAARQLVELAINRMAKGTDFIDVLQLVKNALKTQSRTP